MSSSNSPCAACKFLRRKCTQGCVFAPYFPPDQPSKFANVHRVFGASNVAKLLNELNPPLREDAVNSLAYEAEARLRDPVYGCVGHISQLQSKLKQVQFDLNNAKKELSTYIGPAAFGNFLHQGVYPQAALVAPLHHLQVAQPVAGMAPFGVPGMGMNQLQQQMVVEAQQQAAIVVAREQEMLRSYEQQQHQQEFLRLSNRGFEGFNQAGGGAAGSVGIAAGPPVQQSPQTGLGLVPGQGFENLFHVPQQYQEQPPPPPQQQQLQQHRTLSDEGRSGIGPSS